MKNIKKILVVGSEGQVGTKLVDAFIKRFHYPLYTLITDLDTATAMSLLVTWSL